MFGFLKKHIIKLIIAGVIAIIALNYFLGGEAKQEYILAEALRDDIVQSVSVTGSIKADPNINLHFQKGGKVKSISVEEGEYVSEDQLLASLENRTLELEIERMRANLNYAYAQYNQTKAGAKYEEILIAEAELASANASLSAAEVELDNTRKIGEENIKISTLSYKQAEENRDAANEEYENILALAEKELENLDIDGEGTKSIALDNAYITAKTQLDSFFTVLQDSLFLAEDILGVRGSGFYLLSDGTKDRVESAYHGIAENSYNEALELYQALNEDSTEEEIDTVMTSTLTASNNILLLLSQIGYELEKLPYDRTDLAQMILDVSNQSRSLSTSALSLQETQNTILTLKTGSEQDIETLELSQQLQINAAEAKLNAAENTLLEASHTLEQVKINAETADNNAEAMVALKDASVKSALAMLALKKSPARDVDLAPLLSQIAQAEIALQMAQKEYSDSQLFSPISGIVSFVHGKVGENISVSETALKSFITIQSDKLIVEANVPETDIVKVKNGDHVAMTLDALDFTEKLEGEVIEVDTAETVLQGVIYYQIKTAFDVQDERIKSGMTVNLEIETDRKSDVLMIPIRALKYEDSIKYVDVLNNGIPKKTTITTGIENDQYAQVLSGLVEGDKVITFVK